MRSSLDRVGAIGRLDHVAVNFRPKVLDHPEHGAHKQQLLKFAASVRVPISRVARLFGKVPCASGTIMKSVSHRRRICEQTNCQSDTVRLRQCKTSMFKSLTTLVF
jgi:hypothetical protein